MNSTIKTNQGKTYAVLCANDCIIETIEGKTILEVTADKQAYFVAPDRRVSCSDDSAIITEAFNYALSGESSSGGNESSVDLNTMIDGTIYSSDEDAADNSNFTTAIIDGSRIPVGTYTAIELPQRIGYSTYPHGEKLYLIIQEATSVDDDGEDVFTTIAVSDNANAPTWAATATTARWEFPDGFSLSGGNIKIIPSPTQEVPTELYCFGGRCVSTGVTGDSIIEFYTRREQWRLCARFEGTYVSTIYTHITHSLDSNIHLSEMEQALITSACHVINHEAIDLSDDKLAIAIIPTIVTDYQMGDIAELTVTDITITGASDDTVATAAFWLTTASTAPSIVWPEDAIWLVGMTESSAPTLAASTRYRFVCSQEPNGKLILALDYYYAN